MSEPEWEPWIDTETIRDPVSPWLLFGVVWCLLLAGAGVYLLYLT